MASLGSPEASGISDPQYEQFCEFFYRATGIRFGAQKRYFVDKRLMDRVRETGHRSFSEYMRMLRFEGAETEMQVLIDAMTVNETYFFREEVQLDWMIQSLLPELCSGRPEGGEIRIWSMPCSSGEEPYSIAIKLLEDWSEVDRYEVSIFGTDIDSRMVERARTGLYSQRAVHKLPASILKKYFTGEGSQGYRIIEELRESISFERVNASNRAEMQRYTDFDVILCRNMLIYFDDFSRRKVVDSFYQSLRPGGVLMLGASESLGRTTNVFEVHRVKGAVTYRKPVKLGRRR